MDLKKIVVASTNAGKISEIKSIFTGVEILSMAELGFEGDIEETGATFMENARIKAHTVAKKFGLPALADDSGLCVDALGGAPGIYSARYSGHGAAANRKKLIEELSGKTDRRAHFESAMCLAFPDGSEICGEGKTYGTILHEETGDKGFGYDSLFLSDDLGRSFGLVDEDVKNRVSHRFRALDDLRGKL